jgi:YHS domain-containing protein
MKNIKICFVLVPLLSLYACGRMASNTKMAANATDTAAIVASQEKEDSIKHAALNKLSIVNENDPVCGMPMRRGFDDTAFYKGKLIGFCSKECKDSFIEKPSAYTLIDKQGSKIK